ncbi:hypothetical protein [Bacillus thuringiensis]|uniref:hypothetical protein n=1 Tax=Bacillus thuringiensis TaxID=1428 RepID=UPI000BF3B247|nr:hypothetical protein [Bacillus thuringiensis]PFE87772.1 hypothetical protein CN320_06555 [Bacillus thuringiensis]
MSKIENRCGVCNYDIPMEHASLHRRETDNSLTSYHFACGFKADKLKPCVDCGHHRALCDECKES